MAGKNGTAGTRRVFHAVPQTITFPLEVERAGAMAVVDLVGYHRDRCPVWVSIEVDAARDAYLEGAYVEVETKDDETGEIRTGSQYRYDRVVEVRYRRDVLLAVIQGLQEHEADVLLASADGLDILADLGWFTRVTTPDEAGADPEDGAREDAPTGVSSSPGPAVSMALTTG